MTVSIEKLKYCFRLQIKDDIRRNDGEDALLALMDEMPEAARNFKHVLLHNLRLDMAPIDVFRFLHNYWEKGKSIIICCDEKEFQGIIILYLMHYHGMSTRYAVTTFLTAFPEYHIAAYSYEQSVDIYTKIIEENFQIWIKY